jgi:hypothetical protein
MPRGWYGWKWLYGNLALASGINVFVSMCFLSNCYFASVYTVLYMVTRSLSRHFEGVVSRCTFIEFMAVCSHALFYRRIGHQENHTALVGKV